VRDACFNYNGQRVLTASSDRTARIWDAADGKPLTPPMKHGSKVHQATYSKHGGFVATASDDNTARVWIASTGASAAPAMRHTGSVYRAVFSPDGRCLLTASDENTARVWDADTGELLAPPLRHRAGVLDVAFSPTPADGIPERIATAGADGVARIWSLAQEERPVEDLCAVAQLLAGGQVDANGNFAPLEAGEIHRLWQTLREKYPKAFSPLKAR
jgi:WD40 repeat protein